MKNHFLSLYDMKILREKYIRKCEEKKIFPFTFECYVVSSNPSRGTPCILSKRKIYVVKIKAHNILCDSITIYVYGVVSRCKDFY